MAVFMPMLLLFTGLAVDSGRAYLVKAQLSKAVDGAALSAARNLNGGNPKGEAAKVFNANFPPDFMGATSVTDPSAAPDFYEMHTVEETGRERRHHQGHGHGAHHLHAPRQASTR